MYFWATEILTCGHVWDVGIVKGGEGCGHCHTHHTQVDGVEDEWSVGTALLQLKMRIENARREVV